MKRWFILAFVFLLCAAYPVHAAVIGLETTVGLETVGVEGGSLDSDSLTGLYDGSAGVESASASVALGGATNSSTLTGMGGEVASQGVALVYNTSASSVVKSTSEAVVTYQQEDVLATQFTVNWNLDYALAAYDSMIFEISLVSDDLTVALDSLTVINSENQFGDAWSGTWTDDGTILGTFNRSYTIMITGESYGLNGSSLGGTIDFIFDGGGSIPDPTGDQNPVPEPSTMILLGCGLLGFVRSRRNKRQ